MFQFEKVMSNNAFNHLNSNRMNEVRQHVTQNIPTLTDYQITESITFLYQFSAKTHQKS